MIKRKKRTYINHPKANKNTFINNPKTGEKSFGIINEIDNPKHFISRGEIFLKEGEHIGPNRGFGLQHILFEHKEELANLGYTTPQCVARFVNDVISSGASIYSEFSHLSKQRVTVLKSSLGLVILEERLDGKNEIYYSVVTAYVTNRAHGVLLGNL